MGTDRANLWVIWDSEHTYKFGFLFRVHSISIVNFCREMLKHDHN